MSLKEFFLGKEMREEIDLVRAKATFTMADGTVRTITRRGMGQIIFNSPYVITGRQYLDAYVTGEKTILRDDEGKLFPVSQVRAIEVSQEPLTEVFEWRK